MNRTARFATLLGAVALVAAACGDAPEETDDAAATDAETTAAQADFLGCMVTDSGGVDDRSFNASAWKGLQDAEAELGVEVKYVESATETDFAPNVNQMVSDDCGLIVTVGFLLGDATAAGGRGQPGGAVRDRRLLLRGADSRTSSRCVFDTAQAAFLAGYLAAGMTETGTVATFGGIQLPTVTIFMDGFADGVAHHNEAEGHRRPGCSAGTRKPRTARSPVTSTNDGQRPEPDQNFIQQGADIILPVAGPVGLGPAAAAQEAGNVKLIWVDSDGFESASQYGPLFLTSVVKHIDNAVLDATTQAVDDGSSRPTPTSAPSRTRAWVWRRSTTSRTRCPTS